MTAQKSARVGIKLVISLKCLSVSGFEVDHILWKCLPSDKITHSQLKSGYITTFNSKDRDLIWHLNLGDLRGIQGKVVF